MVVWWAGRRATAYPSVRSPAASSCWPPTSPRCCSSYGPPSLPLGTALLGRWLRRGAGVPSRHRCVWLVAVVVDGQPEPPGIWVAGLACAVVVCIVAATAVTMREDQV